MYSIKGHEKVSMTKHMDSTISLLDAVDKIFDTATNFISSSNSSMTGYVADNTFTDPYWNNQPLHYNYAYWTWPAIITDIPKIDVPSYPVCNGWIKEDGSMYLTFAATGFDKSELLVRAEDNTLIVEGALKKKEDTSKWKNLFHNIAMHDFVWKRRISNKYDLEKLKVKLEKGILEILIPLKDTCKPVKKEFEIK